MPEVNWEYKFGHFLKLFFLLHSEIHIVIIEFLESGTLALIQTTRIRQR